MGATLWRTGTITALTAGLAITGMPAATALPVQDARQGTDISCWAEVAGGSVELFTFFDSSGELAESFGSVFMEEAQGWAYDGEGSLAADAFSATLGFVTGDAGTPLGTLTVTGDVEPLGDPIEIDDRYRDGNAWSEVEGTVQQLLVSGSITAATGDLVGLEGTALTCDGAEVDLTFSGSTPATRIYRGTGANAFCQIGSDGFLAVDVFDQQAYGTLALGVDFDEETADLVAQGELDTSSDAITGTLDVIWPEGESGQVEVDLAVGPVVDSGTFRYKTPQAAFTQRYETRVLTGTAVLPDGTVVAIEDCELQEYRYMDRFSPRAADARPPRNDAPADAIEIRDRQRVRTSTLGAAPEAEAPCDAVPIGATVWYRVEGTGEDVTLSTVGSSFDTVIGVYTADSLTEVACVDDTLETGLQATVTFPTDAGTEYLVQVGGFGGSAGSLLLTRS